MARNRAYRMLCPITRALDHLGDKWSLLILRDLHAGPMRFSDLRQGLPGLASNLLTTRLDALQVSGLVAHSARSYTLTDLGRQTDRLLWELARLGTRFPPDDDLRAPGHLRLAAVTLQSAMRTMEAPPGFSAALVLDDTPLVLSEVDGRFQVRHGIAASPWAEIRTEYEALIAASEGLLPLEVLHADHCTITGPHAEAARAMFDQVLTEGFRAP